MYRQTDRLPSPSLSRGGLIRIATGHRLIHGSLRRIVQVAVESLPRRWSVPSVDCGRSAPSSGMRFSCVPFTAFASAGVSDQFFEAVRRRIGVGSSEVAK